MQSWVRDWLHTLKNTDKKLTMTWHHARNDRAIVPWSFHRCMRDTQWEIEREGQQEQQQNQNQKMVTCPQEGALFVWKMVLIFWHSPTTACFQAQKSGSWICSGMKFVHFYFLSMASQAPISYLAMCSQGYTKTYLTFKMNLLFRKPRKAIFVPSNRFLIAF